MNDAIDDENANQDASLPDSAKPPRVRIPRLTTIANVRREMARQYACHLRAEIGNKCLGARMSALRGMIEAFIAHDYEKRVKYLEERINARS